MPQHRTRTERNDPRQWSAKSGGPGGAGHHTVSDCADGYTRRWDQKPRPASTYRGARRNRARVIRASAAPVVQRATEGV